MDCAIGKPNAEPKKPKENHFELIETSSTPMAQIGKIMRVLAALGIELQVSPPTPSGPPMPDRSLAVWLLGELVGRLTKPQADRSSPVMPAG
jgi:hypothetical protein